MKTLEALADVAQDYWELILRYSPIWATQLGDYRYNHRLPEIGPEARAAWHKEIISLQKRLHESKEEGLVDEDKVTWDILRLKFETDLEEEQYKFYQWEVDQMSGPQVWLLELLNFHPLRDEKDYEDLLSRWKAFPRYIDQYLGNLQEGVREKRVAPKIAVERVINQLRTIVKTTVEESSLYQAVNKFPQSFSTETKSTFTKRITQTISDTVVPAYQKLLNYLEKEYVSKARQEVGLWALPDGNKAYQFRIRTVTTVNLTADEIHEIGLQELKSLQNQMLAIARKHGHKGDLLSFAEKINKDPKNFAKTREELLEGYRTILKKAQAKLPDFFSRLPQAPCEVRPMEDYREKDAVTAFYYSPATNGSRPGIFYANTYKLDARPKYNMVALTVHEAVPGHHLQVALAQEIKELPAFRRHSLFTAYVEGWGLYSERLAEEMGMYEDDLSRFGMLVYQAWRAARLVVDTGLHAKRWTREQTIEFLQKNVPMTEQEVLNEVDRYIIWPGQALGYKIGQREIEDLRAKAQKELGDAFDVREFHDEVLRHGSVPLPTLRKNIERSIEQKKKLQYKTAKLC